LYRAIGLIAYFIVTAARADSSSFFDCMIENMKGQPASMQAIVTASCRKRYPIDRYVTIRQPTIITSGQYQYVIDRLSWRNMILNNVGRSSPYVVIIYDSLPTAPNLGSLTFSYSSLSCGSDDPASWSLPISVSLKPIDLTALKADESRFWDVGDFPPWVQVF
jgi:hypothetical protein